MRIWLTRTGSKPQPCLPDMVDHMVKHYGYAVAVDQAAAALLGLASPKRKEYDVKAYWRKARRRG